MVGKTVRLPDGTRKNIFSNEVPYDLNCPIDGTQLVERRGIDYVNYACFTCNANYHIRRGHITSEGLDKQAKTYIRETKERLTGLETEKSELLKILDLAEKNSFDFDD